MIFANINLIKRIFLLLVIFDCIHFYTAVPKLQLRTLTAAYKASNVDSTNLQLLQNLQVVQGLMEGYDKAIEEYKKF